MLRDEYFGRLSGSALTWLIALCSDTGDRDSVLHPDIAAGLNMRERMALYALLGTPESRNDVLVKAQRECEVRRVRTQQ